MIKFKLIVTFVVSLIMQLTFAVGEEGTLTPTNPLCSATAKLCKAEAGSSAIAVTAMVYQDFNWYFPYKWGNTTLYNTNLNSDGIDHFVPTTTTCPGFIGIIPSTIPCLGFSFWAPRGIMEVVKTPACLISFGGVLYTTAYCTYFPEKEQQSNSMQSHFIELPNLDYTKTIMKSTSDTIAPWYSNGYGSASFSEPNTIFQKDAIALVLTPWALLVPAIAAVTEPIQGAATAIGYPLDAIPALVGQAGASVPPSRTTSQCNNDFHCNQGIAVKHLQLMHSALLSNWTAGPLSMCFSVPNPIYKPSQYRLQAINPVNISGRATPPGGLNLSPIPSNYPYKEGTAFILWQAQQRCIMNTPPALWR